MIYYFFVAEDVLTEDKGECVICLEDLCQGDTIARLPCLCIYHKTCIDEWFQVSRLFSPPPPHSLHFPVLSSSLSLLFHFLLVLFIYSLKFALTYCFTLSQVLASPLLCLSRSISQTFFQTLFTLPFIC